MSDEQPEPAPDATAARADTPPGSDDDADDGPGREPDVGEVGRGAGADPSPEPDREGATGAEERAVDLLAWLFETETLARIYVHLCREPWATSSEVAEAVDRYPSTVREALADLAADEVLERRKRAAGGAGNNPYEYKAVPPGELLGELVGEFQHELNALCRLGDDEPVEVAVEHEGERESEAGSRSGPDAVPEGEAPGVEPPTEGGAGADPGAGSGNPKR